MRRPTIVQMAIRNARDTKDPSWLTREIVYMERGLADDRKWQAKTRGEPYASGRFTRGIKQSATMRVNKAVRDIARLRAEYDRMTGVSSL